MKARAILFIYFVMFTLCISETVSAAQENALAAGIKSDITIGVILPLSGPYQEYGEKVLKSLILAGNFFLDNQQNPVTLLIEDSASDSEKAIQGFIKLTQNPNMAAVLGPLSSEESMAAAREAQKRGIPLLTLTRNETVTAAGNYVFNVLPSSHTQVNRLARYAVINRSFKRVAVLHPDTPFGRNAADAFDDAVKKEGGRVVRYVAYKDTDTDFSNAIGILLGKELNTDDKLADGRKIVHKIGFDALFIPDSAQRISQILSQFSFYNVRGFQLLGQSGMNVPDILMAHRELFDGAIFVDGYFLDGTMPQSTEFADRFYESYGREADAMDAYTCDAMTMLLNLLRSHSGLTREQLKEVLTGMKAEGVRGTISVNSNRVMDSEPILITVKDGYPIRIIIH